MLLKVIKNACSASIGGTVGNDTGEYMSKLHYCMNGTSVTDQVIKYQTSHDDRDYLPIQMYYERYKDRWYNKVKDHIDRSSFDSDYDYRLVKAVESFDISTAEIIADKKGYNSLAAFNGWFYSCLSNWTNNIITSSYRMKKRPTVLCPICGRAVTNITEEHLKHYKTASDLPRCVLWHGNIFEVCMTPKSIITCWGEFTQKKMRELNKNITRPYVDSKHKMLWPWYDSKGNRAVLCPFTRKMIPKIDDNYIRSLPDEFNRYAEPIGWNTFIEKNPNALLHADIYSLDHISDDGSEISLSNYISKDMRFNQESSYMDWEMIKSGKSNTYYDQVFNIIDKYVSGSNRNIFKLLAIGYSIDDIADTLNVDKKLIKETMKIAKGLTNMKEDLIDSACLTP